MSAPPSMLNSVAARLTNAKQAQNAKKVSQNATAVPMPTNAAVTAALPPMNAPTNAPKSGFFSFLGFGGSRRKTHGRKKRVCKTRRQKTRRQKSSRK